MKALIDFLPFILMFVVMYIFFIMPKQKEMKKTEEMRKALKKGDKVTTIAGIIGVVAHVDDHTISLKTGDNVRLDFEKSAVSRLIAHDSEK